MILPGLVSITFRELSPLEIVNLCVEAGLKGIEWGGDVHCPHGDIVRAEEARRLSEEAGIAIPAYGSYYRLADDEGGVSFGDALASTLALGAQFVRLWAGKRASSEANLEDWISAAEDLRRVADAAGEEGVGVSLEYHQHSLTDSIESTDRLLEMAAHPNVHVNWQPTNFQPFEYSHRALDAVLPRLSNLHVFCWDYVGRDKVRRPLAEGREDWERYFEKARELPGDRYALLEFVKDDRPEQLIEDAVALREFLNTARVG